MGDVDETPTVHESQISSVRLSSIKDNKKVEHTDTIEETEEVAGYKRVVTPHIAKESMYNTPPVFAVYTSLLTLQWLKSKGGIAAIEKEIADNVSEEPEGAE